MLSQSTRPLLPKPDAGPFLIGSIPDNNAWLTGCPHAATLVGTWLGQAVDIVIALPCRRWGCSWCGPKRLASLAYKVEAAKPTRLITLTVDPKLYTDPRHAFDCTRRQVSELGRKARVKLHSFEYVRILEVTKKGWPHYHLVTRCPYIKQADLSAWWQALSGALIVDVRKIYEGQNVYRYVMKYLGKQLSVPWTRRRVTFTRNFFIRTEHKKQTKYILTSKVRYYKGVDYVLSRAFRDRFAYRLETGVYAIVSQSDDWRPPAQNS